MNNKVIRKRRLNSTALTTFVGQHGELVVNTTDNTLVIQDGTTAGGYKLLRYNEPITTSHNAGTILYNTAVDGVLTSNPNFIWDTVNNRLQSEIQLKTARNITVVFQGTTNYSGSALFDATADITITLSPVISGGTAGVWTAGVYTLYTNNATVGIGTTTPSKLLHLQNVTVNSVAYSPEILFTDTLATAYNQNLYFGFASNIFYLRTTNGVASTADALQIITSNTSTTAGISTIVFPNGNIGIGKTPSTLLDVNGTVTATSFSGPLSGNSTTATTLQTSRTISLTTDATATGSFNGSANLALAVTLATVNSIGATPLSYNIPTITVNQKGLITSIVANTISGTTNQTNVSYASNTYTISLSSNLILPGIINLIAATTATASINIATGTNPTTPNIGDFWFVQNSGISGYYKGSVGAATSAIHILADLDSVQTLTNKSISGSANTLSNIPTSALSSTSSSNVVSTLVLRDASGNFSAGTITANLIGNASTATALATTINVSLTGSIINSSSITWNGVGNLSIPTSINGQAVILGTNTSGSYIATGSVSGNGLTGTASGAGSTFTITSNATSSNTANTLVYRNASGNFSTTSITFSDGTTLSSANVGTYVWNIASTSQTIAKGNGYYVSTASITLTLPTTPTTGDTLAIISGIASGTYTIAAASGTTVMGSSTVTVDLINSSFYLVAIGTDWRIL